jgi:hypothetical protein
VPKNIAARLAIIELIEWVNRTAFMKNKTCNYDHVRSSNNDHEAIPAPVGENAASAHRRQFNRKASL